MMQIKTLAFVLYATTSLAAGSGVRGAAVHHHHALNHPTAGAPVAAGGDSSQPAIPTTVVDLEIKNANYYDMTDTWEDPMGKGGKSNDAMGEMDGDRPDFGEMGPDPCADACKGLEGTCDGPEDQHKPECGKCAACHMAEDDKHLHEHLDKHLDKHMDNVEDGFDDMADGLGDLGNATDAPDMGGDLGGILGAINLAGPAWGTRKGAFMQLDSVKLARRMATWLAPLKGKVTVQRALKHSVEGAIKNMLGCGPAMSSAGPAPAGAPGPAPAPAGPQMPSGLFPAAAPAAALVQTQLRAPAPAPAPGPAPGPSPGPASMCQRPKVHVAVMPGDKMKKRHMVNKPANTPRLANGAPAFQTTKLRVTLFDRPGNGIDDMAKVKTKLKHALHHGELKAVLKVAIQAVTGVEPKIGGLKVKKKLVELWDIQKCGAHMSNIVKTFSVHYTRSQVPMALINECNTFMTKISFSHDHVLDHRDAVNCRKATKSFEKRWHFGKKDNPKDFQMMCIKFCQAKYGDDAPNCHFE